MDQPQVGDVVGRYRLDRLLGAGGMGVVYAATDTRLQREVAVKVMSRALAADPGFRARFDREATALARLESPHVIDVFDHGEHPPGPGGAPYLVTRLVRGGDLASLLKARGPLPLRMAAGVVAQVAEALRDAHAAGIVHRDVKPGNVLLRDPDERAPSAALCDFGIATVDQGDATALTASGVGVSGTWGYMAPERIDGGPGTPASDLYALGCLLWATLTGRAPWSGTPYAVADAHHRAPVPQLGRPDELSAAVDRLLAATMAKDPARRPASADVVRAQLQEIAEGRVPGAAPSPARGRRRGRVVLAGAAAVLLVAGVTTAVLTRPDDPRADPVTDPTTGTAEEQQVEEREPAGDPGADVNDDGLGDLVLQIGRSADAQRFTWLSDGSRFLGPGETPGTRGLPLRGDVDGDGLPDTVVVSRDGQDQEVDVELGTDGSLEASFPPLALSELFTVVRDVDGDGLDDLSNWGVDTTGRLRWHTATSTGEGFAEREELELPDLRGGYLQPGDYDGDGLVDLAHVVPEAGDTGTVQVLLRTGPGTDDGFEAVGEPRPSLGPADLALSRTADVDGDDVDELVQVVTDPEERTIRVWDLEGSTLRGDDWFSGPSEEGAALQLTPAVTDVDGDGRDDLVLWRLASETTLGLDVVRSTGTAFEEGEEWTRWDCSPICFRPLTVVSPST